MISLAHWIFFIFAILIIVTLILRKQPILAAAIGLFGVGLADKASIPGAIQVSFRALSLATENLLSLILLIGMVVSMTKLLQESGADLVLTQPLRRLRSSGPAYWTVGFVMWGLTLLIWPTPAVTLLGAVIIPALAKTGIHPMGMAICLTIFGEGLGLSGDFVIQGAPSLLSKATGIAVSEILAASWPVVLLSGVLAALVGNVILRRFPVSNLAEVSSDSEFPAHRPATSKLAHRIALIVGTSYCLTVITMLVGGIKGDGASALTGGVTFLLLCLLTLLKDGKNAFFSFIEYIKNGLRFSMGVFAPIVIMAGFFFLGTQTGNQQILFHEGRGFFADFANLLTTVIPLSKWTVGVFIIVTAILGSMDGSGFSALPLVGGMAVAMSQAAGLPAVHLAVLGQVVGIWTGAALVPWGFSAVTAAIAGVDANTLARYNLPSYLAAVISAFIFTMALI